MQYDFALAANRYIPADRNRAVLAPKREIAAVREADVRMMTDRGRSAEITCL
jgi:hypothetical protein